MGRWTQYDDVLPLILFYNCCNPYAILSIRTHIASLKASHELLMMPTLLVIHTETRMVRFTKASLANNMVFWSLLAPHPPVAESSNQVYISTIHFHLFINTP
jgi:hypothetical protein